MFFGVMWSLVGIGVASTLWSIWKSCRAKLSEESKYDGTWIGWLILASALAFLTAIPGISMLAERSSERSCVSHAQEYKVNHRYSMTLGCRFETKDGRFIDSDKWRVND